MIFSETFKAKFATFSNTRVFFIFATQLEMPFFHLYRLSSEVKTIYRSFDNCRLQERQRTTQFTSAAWTRRWRGQWRLQTRQPLLQELLQWKRSRTESTENSATLTASRTKVKLKNLPAFSVKKKKMKKKKLEKGRRSHRPEKSEVELCVL